MTSPEVAILIVSWNRCTDTLACLESLRKIEYPNYRVIVIDNASSDGSPDAVRAGYPEVSLIEAGDNLGFVGGNNLGLDEAARLGSTYALLLNNDTEVDPAFLGKLVEAAQANPQAAMLGPTIYYHSQPEVVWSAGGAIDWQRGETRMLGLGETDQGQFGSAPRPVDFVTGCALLVRMDAVQQIGPLDPRFYAYFEETEWCVRARRAGYQIIHVPQARIWHKISPEIREASPLVQYYMTRNRLLFLKLVGRKQALFSTYYDLGKRLVSWSVKPRWRNKTAQRQALVRGLVDFGRGKFGRAEW